MIRSLACAASLLFGTALTAETIEVKMLNKGAEGTMVFEPAYVAAQPGDIIHFISTDKGHNAESIDGMLPDGVEAFKSKLGADFELTVEAEGLYGIKCTPHYALGMVALIQVGEAVNLEAAKGVKQRGKAAKRFDPLFESVQ
ncbi:pseudoazurin [Roseobacter sp. EG26]|uniref:pseudoazurin n=1 Tax=Roseobacter sp. EG26 TaxID=3412477 RepID=UPI003CE5A778